MINQELIQDMANNGPAATKEINQQLYERLRTGDATARDEMITANMPLVIAIVSDYVEAFPKASHLTDDLVSEGMLALCESVDKISNGHNCQNPSGWLGACIGEKIGKIMDQEQLIGSTRTRRRARKDNKDMPERVFELPDNPDHHDPVSMLELREEINACCESDEDYMIVELREKGHTDTDIAKQLDMPYTTTYMRRRAIYKRFLERTEMRGEV